MRRVEDITEALWGSKVSPETVSHLNQKLYVRIEAWRNEKITDKFPYVYLDGICLKRSWGGEVTPVSVLVAIGVNEEGYRKIIGIAEGAKEDFAGWNQFLRRLKERGLRGVKLIISDKCLGLIEALGAHYPKAKWQRCVVHFYRNVMSQVPNRHLGQVCLMLKAIHAQECKTAALAKGKQIAQDLARMKLKAASRIVEQGYEETLRYMEFPLEHWVRIRTNNPLERIMREIRRRTRVVGCFPDGQSALMLAAARLRHIAGTKWGTARYPDMELLKKKMIQDQMVA